MIRRSDLLILVVALLGAVALLVYRTPISSTEPATASFSGVSLRMEYATTSATRERGLGGRESLAPDRAMLFVFPKDSRYGFWMKDMLIPLDMFWLDSKGQVVSIAQDVEPSSYPNVFYPTQPARYVLETAAGFALAHGVVVGTPLILKVFPTVSE